MDLPQSNECWGKGAEVVKLGDWLRPICRAAAAAAIALAPLDLFDFVSLGAAGRDYLDARALGLADKSAGKRRGNGNFALLCIGFRLAHQLPDLLLGRVLVDEGDGRAEFYRLAAQLGHIDHLGARQLVLKLGAAALRVRLRLLGGMGLGSLGRMPVRGRVF